jgi:hypothetical protein
MVSKIHFSIIFLFLSSKNKKIKSEQGFKERERDESEGRERERERVVASAELSSWQRREAKFFKVKRKKTFT